MGESRTVQSAQKLGDVGLRSLWCSVFSLDTFPVIEEHELQEVTLLVNTLLMLFKKLHSKLKEAEDQYGTIKTELQASVVEVNQLKKELKRANESSCQNCLILEKEVDKYVKKLKDHESRINSIANILNLQNGQDSEPDEKQSTARAYDLVSQMLLGTTKPPVQAKRRCREERNLDTSKRKKIRSTNKHLEHREGISDSEESTPQHDSDMLQKDDLAHTSKNIVIPETLWSFPQATECPVQLADNILDKEVQKKCSGGNSGKTSPVISSNTPIKPSLKHVKNLSEVQVSSNSPGKVLSVNTSNAESNTVAALKSTTADENQDLGKYTSRADLTNKIGKKPDFWNLKPNYSVELKPGDKQSRRLKQTQLSVGSFAKRIDVGSLEEFNEGIRKTSTQYSAKICTDLEDELLQKAIQESLKYSEDRLCVSEDDDIVAESPNATQKKKANPLQDNINRVCDTDMTIFLPPNMEKRSNGGASSVSKANCIENKAKNERPTTNLDADKKGNTSFDRIPTKTGTSPDYKYRRGAVRKKDQRQALEGWECDICKKYYETGKDDTAAAQKQHMNHCSRHRDKYPVRAKTPPGFWDPDFPTTQQCRSKMLDVTQASNISKTKGKKCTK
ncbi:DNA endonuclease RBBP8-like isoform X1 [Schistocerca nitens]|uniref:DNA endonuclease RBBP8-like isoform X1 n=1 Tax=Schistocerca nitens TaxID=7011 RepID=UPI0021181E4C|nr:DNA endonuclease RBBP8-like isoform X1 [Schistocerca nitens]